MAGAGARRLALASALGWLGFGALSLAIVLTVQRAAGSPAAAGAALAAFALGSGVLAPCAGGWWTATGRAGRWCRSRSRAGRRCSGSRSRRRRAPRPGSSWRWRRSAG